MAQASGVKIRMSEPETRAADAYPPDGSASDARLLEEVRRGNHAAFEPLVRRYEARLMNVLLRFVRDRELARDLSQETFLRVFERLDQFDPSRRFGPWLFRIGVNLALDFMRKRKRRIWPVLFGDSRSEKAPDPAIADPRRALDLEQEVRHVLESIPEKYRTVLILRDLENFSNSEIAAILNRKEATIRWRLVEARLRFEQLWGRRQAAGSQGVRGEDSETRELNESDSHELESDVP
jgi:RNA polymerase sigma-70 factor (ECF subfamily)